MIFFCIHFNLIDVKISFLIVAHPDFQTSTMKIRLKTTYLVTLDVPELNPSKIIKMLSSI